MMKHTYILLLLVTIFSCKTALINGQDTKINKKAEIAYNKALEYSFERNYEKTIEKLEEAIKIEPSYLNANLKLADLYQGLLKDYPKAVEIYKNIEGFSPGNMTALYGISYCYYNLKDFENAEKSLNRFINHESAGGKSKANAELLLKNINFSKEALKTPLDIRFKNLGPEINSSKDEYFPSITSDNQSLYFTVNDLSDAFTNEDIYVAENLDQKWNGRKRLNSSVNSSMNEGAHCISSNGKYLLFASDNYVYGQEGTFDIFLAKKEGDRWQRPMNMGRNINSRQWDSQPTLTADSRQLFFVSTKKGGLGGADIYISTIGEDGQFGEAENIGAVINTQFDEQRPYLHPDGKTIYFASGGHPGMGGIDLFKSTKDENGNWSKPINLGYPINTSGNEFGIFVSADGKTAYISSDRAGGYGGQDIYSFDLPETIRPDLVSYIKGTVIDSESRKSMQADIKIYDLETGDLVASFSSDKFNGSFLNTIIGDKDYAFEAEAAGFLPFSENISLKGLKENEAFLFDVPMKKVALGKEFVLKNIFFETNKFELLEASKVELNYLLSFLKVNKSLKIEIGGHTDNVGSSASNQVLSENRAKSVMSYLIENGIETNRISAKGFGDTKPLVANDSDENKAKNRRTSFKVVN